MKKIIFILCFFLFINVSAKVKVYLFYGDGCPHCAKFEEYVDKNKEKYNFEISKYEVWHNSLNKKILNTVASKFNDEQYGVPYIVVGNKRIIGWNDNKKKQFLELIAQNKKYIYCDIVNNPDCNKNDTGVLKYPQEEKMIVYLKKYMSLLLKIFG